MLGGESAHARHAVRTLERVSGRYVDVDDIVRDEGFELVADRAGVVVFAVLGPDGDITVKRVSNRHQAAISARGGALQSLGAKRARPE
jgi:hypothetical protein